MTPAIPKGWRKLRVGEWPRPGDKADHCNGYFRAMTQIACFSKVTPGETIIRKIRK